MKRSHSWPRLACDKSAVVSDLPRWDPCHSYPAPITITVPSAFVRIVLFMQLNQRSALYLEVNVGPTEGQMPA